MGTREVGRAGGPVGLRHQTGAADISLKNRTILLETQNVFWFFVVCFCSGFQKTNWEKSGGEKQKRRAGGAAS